MSSIYVTICDNTGALMACIDKAKTSKLVDLIIEKHQEKSYRRMAKEDFSSSLVKPGTLCRIAKSNGRWLPKSRKILTALGLIEKSEMPQWMKTWRHLPTDERHRVIKEYLKWKNKS